MAFEFVVADVELPAPEVEVELLALDELDEQAARSSSADDPIVATAVPTARRLVPKYTDTVTPVDWHEVVETPACRRFAGSYQPIDRLATRQTPRPLAGQRQGVGHDPPTARQGEGTPPDDRHARHRVGTPDPGHDGRTGYGRQARIASDGLAARRPAGRRAGAGGRGPVRHPAARRFPFCELVTEQCQGNRVGRQHRVGRGDAERGQPDQEHLAMPERIR
jgi:hypothetical protein